MENEINYISEKVEYLGILIDRMNDKLNGVSIGTLMKKLYNKYLVDFENEKQILENILTALTLTQLSGVSGNIINDKIDKVDAGKARSKKVMQK